MKAVIINDIISTDLLMCPSRSYPKWTNIFLSILLACAIGYCCVGTCSACADQGQITRDLAAVALATAANVSAVAALTFAVSTGAGIIAVGFLLSTIATTAAALAVALNQLQADLADRCCPGEN
jgi:hypothetical protein